MAASKIINTATGETEDYLTNQYREEQANPESVVGGGDSTPIKTNGPGPKMYGNILRPVGAPQVVSDLQKYSYAKSKSSIWDEGFVGDNWQDLERHRVENQPNWVKGLYTLGGGIISGLGTAVEDAGYFLDYATYASIFSDIDFSTANSMNLYRRIVGGISKFGRGIKEATERDIMPVYEAPSEEGDYSDMLFKWGSLKSVIDSAVGFGITGMGVGAAVKGISKLALKGVTAWGSRAALSAMETGETVSKLALRAKNAEAYINIINNKLPQLFPSMGAAVSGTVTKAIEGRMEAAEAYENYLIKYAPLVEQGIVSQEELEAAASENASTVFDYTMATALGDMLIMKQFFKGPNVISKKLSAPTLWNRNKHMLELGMIKEGAEESLQEAAQMEGDYGTYQNLKNVAAKRMFDAKTNEEYAQATDAWNKMKALNFDAEQLPQRYGERFLGFLTSNRSLVAGTIGIVSGPLQGKLVGLPGRKVEKAQMKEAYETQQAQFKENESIFKSEESLKNKIKQAVTGNQMIEAATLLGDKELVDVSEDVMLSAITHDNLIKGSTQQLKEIIKEEGSAQASSRITKIEQLEDEFKQAKRFVNSDQMFNLMQDIKHTEKLIEIYKAKEQKKGISHNTRKSYKDQRIQFEELLDELNSTFDRLSTKQAQVEISQSYINSQQKQSLVDKIGKSKDIPELLKYRDTYPELSDEINTRIDFLKNVGNIGKTSKTTNNTTEITNTKDNLSPDETTTEGQIEKVSNKIKNKEKLSKNEENIVENNPAQVLENTAKAEEPSDVIVDSEGNKYSKKSKEYLASKNQVKPGAKNILTKQFGLMALNTSGTALEVTDGMVDELADAIVQSKIQGLDPNAFTAKINKAATDIYNRAVNAPIDEITTSEPIDLENTHDDKIEDNSDVLVNARNNLFTKLDELNDLDTNNDQDLIDPDANQRVQKFKEVRDAFETVLQAFDVKGIKINSFKDFMNNIGGDVKDLQKYFTTLKGLYIAYYNQEVPETTYAELMGTTEPDITSNFDENTTEKIRLVIDNMENIGRLVRNADDIMDIYLNESITDISKKNSTPAVSIAHLTRDWAFQKIDDTSVKKSDINKKVNSNPIINPEKFNAGTPVKLELHDYDGDVNLVGTGSKISWYQLQEIDSQGTQAWEKFLRDNKLEPDLTIYDFWPIKITSSDGELIGHVHQTNWINKISTLDNIKAEQKKFLSTFRKNLVHQLRAVPGSSFETIITGKKIERINGHYNGFALNQESKPMNTAQALPDNLSIGLKVVSDLDIPSKASIKDNVMNMDEVDKLYSGTPFIFIPLGKKGGQMKYHASPLVGKRLSANQARTVTQTIRMFVEQDYTINKPLYNAFKAQGLNILTKTGLSKALSKLITLYNPVKNGTLESTIYSRQGKDPLGFIELSDNNVLFGKSSVVKLTKGNKMTDKQLRLLEENVLPYMYVNVNRELLNKKTPFNFVEVDENNKIISYEGDYNTFVKQNTETYMRSQLLDDGSYSSTLQNITTFDMKELAKEPEIRKEQQEGIPVEVTSKSNQDIPMTSLHKGQKVVYWTTIKGTRQEWETDEVVTIEAVSKHGVLINGEWKNFKENWHHFKSLPIEVSKIDYSKNPIVVELANHFKQDINTFMNPVNTGQISYEKYIQAKQAVYEVTKNSNKFCK